MADLQLGIRKERVRVQEEAIRRSYRQWWQQTGILGRLEGRIRKGEGGVIQSKGAEAENHASKLNKQQTEAKEHKPKMAQRVG